MKIVLLDGYASNPGDMDISAFYELGDFTAYDRTAPELVVERIGDAEIVILNKIKLDAEIMDKCPKLKYIGVLATGYDVVDIAAAKERGLIVTNIPAYSTPSVVQHTFALLLELCCSIAIHNRSVKEGKWSSCPDYTYWERPLIELSGKTMGIIGLGQIGSAVSKVALSFGMNVLACASRPRKESGIDGVRMAELDEVLAVSDVISLHCPLTEDNKNLIGAAAISKMRDGAIVINTSRGGLINEEDMANALKSGKLGGFAADVLATEPPVNGSPLFQAPNCVITPHIAWAPFESRARLFNTAIENVRSYIAGRPQNVV